MGDESADLIFTDPPAAELTAADAHLSGSPAGRLQPFLATLFSHYRRLVKPRVALYICHPPAWQREFQNALESAGFAIAGQIIWARQTIAFSSERYQLQHEPLFYGHVAGQVSVWYGDQRRSTLWAQDQPGANPAHGKPVELVERALLDSSRKGDLVADLFAGSGATLIACERLARRARVMQSDPRGADAMVMRWQQYAGQSAVLDGARETFQEMAEQRRRPAA
jgi:DNA modification methylase